MAVVVKHEVGPQMVKLYRECEARIEAGEDVQHVAASLMHVACFLMSGFVKERAWALLARIAWETSGQTVGGALAGDEIVFARPGKERGAGVN